MEWKSIDLSYELSFTCGGNINYYKSVHHPIPTHENREHPGNLILKVYSPLGQTEGERKVFLGGCKKGPAF